MTTQNHSSAAQARLNNYQIPTRRLPEADARFLHIANSGSRAKLQTLPDAAQFVAHATFQTILMYFEDPQHEQELILPIVRRSLRTVLTESTFISEPDRQGVNVMWRDARLVLPFVLLLTATLTCIPAASATTITDNASDGTIMKASVPGAGSLPLAKCSSETESDQSASLHNDLAACLDARIGPSMESLLRLLGEINPPTTGIVNTTTGSTAVLGPLCSGSCFAATTPTQGASVSTVPEPGTLVLLGPAFIGLIGLARNRFFKTVSIPVTKPRRNT